MKMKRLMAAAMAGVFAIGVAATPAMAAGGTVEVDVETKEAVIRVVVPTNMAVSVDQFQMLANGSESQIYSGEFDITNKSQINVKVDVKSTVTLASSDPIKLVDSIAKVADSDDEDGEAWMAVAAMSGASEYDDKKTTDTETLKDLTEGSSNVATILTDATSNKSEASQTFYLAKPATTTVSYKAMKFSDSDTLAASQANVPGYAECYKLTELATQPTDDDTLQTAVKSNDIYVMPSAATDGADVTKIEKDSTVASGTFAGTNKYYTADTTKVAVADLTTSSGSTFVYGFTADGGKAGFRYIGRLSEAKDTWTKDDIKHVSIAYDIKGITETGYAAVKDDCEYGLYIPAPAGPVNVLTSDGTNDIVIYYTGNTPESIVVTPITVTSGNTAPITRTMAANSNHVSIEAGCVKLLTAWLPTLKTSRGTGTYKVTINSEDFTITLE